VSYKGVTGSSSLVATSCVSVSGRIPTNHTFISPLPARFVAGRSAFSIGNLEPAANRRKDASRPLAQKRWRFAGEQRYREEPLESHIVSADLNRAPVRKIQLFGPERQYLVVGVMQYESFLAGDLVSARTTERPEEVNHLT